MQKEHNPPAAIILAAGTSSRIGNGRHKLLLPLGERPVLAHTIAATVASQTRPIIVVLGHQATLVRSAIAPFIDGTEVITVENPHYLQGMSTSIHAGIHALQSRAHPPTGALIILGDQPLLSSHILDTLILAKNTTSKPIIVPLYDGKRGNPVLFDRSLFPELLQVSGDEGGRSAIERHRQDVIGVELGDAMATYDVDTWEEYQVVVAEWSRKLEFEGMNTPKHTPNKQQAIFWLEYSQRLSTAIRYVEALGAVERAITLDETSAEAWYVKGTCLAMLARYDEAQTDFEHALQLDPLYVPAWDAKAWVLGILGKKEQALAAVHRALELDPDYFEAQRRKVRISLG